MIGRATPQLLDLAMAVRSDWDRHELESAVAAATVAGMPWPRILTEMVRLMTRPESSPRELAAQAADPRSAYGHDPEAYRSGLAAARDALNRSTP
jgi:hypothetical protein